jgi:cytochrome c556
MMKLALLAGVLVVSTTVVVGCARVKSMVGMGDPIAERQQLMKNQGATVKAIQDKMKAGQHQAIAPDLEKLVKTAGQIPALFPKDSLDPKTSKATQVAAVSQTGTAQATGAAVGDMIKTTCVKCHDSFRGPEIKK